MTRRSALRQALYMENLDQLDRVISRDLTALDTETDQGVVPLIATAQKGWGDAVVLLVRRGANPNAQDALGRTALMMLARQESTTAIPGVDALLAVGARTDLVNDGGEHALSIAAGAGQAWMVERLLRHDPRWLNALPEKAHWRPLEAAALDGQVSMCVSLMEHGAHPNAPHVVATKPSDSGMYNGWHPLHFAASQGHVDTVNALLNAGADPHGHTLRGETAMRIAQHRRHDAVVSALESHVLRQTLHHHEKTRPTLGRAEPDSNEKGRLRRRL